MKNKKLKKMLPYGIFVLGLVASLTMFLPTLHLEGETYTGLQLMLGVDLVEFEFLGLEVASARIEPNMVAMATFLSPFIAGVLTLIFKKGNTFSLAVFVLAGVLFFIFHDYVEIQYQLLEGERESTVPQWDTNLGVLLGAFASILAAIGEMLHISATDK